MVSVVVALAIAFPLAVLAHRRRWVIQPITWLERALHDPGARADLVVLPITGLSLTTVVIPLISYNLLILFRNTLAGIDGVDDDVLEAARGMGLEDRQLLWRVQIPLAIPVIIAGVRIATVSSIGLVADRGLIGHRGGFGQFILLGLNTFFWTALVVGVVLSMAFAFAADMLLLGLQRLATPWAGAAGVSGGRGAGSWRACSGSSRTSTGRARMASRTACGNTYRFRSSRSRSRRDHHCRSGSGSGTPAGASSSRCGVRNVGRSIPSLAVLGIAFLLAVKLSPAVAFGFPPIVVALTLLAIPVILINTYVRINRSIRIPSRLPGAWA